MSAVRTGSLKFPGIPSLFCILGLFFQGCSTKSLQEYTPVTKSLELPESALYNLGAAIRIPTISYEEADPEEFDTLQFRKFHAFLEERYPLVHTCMNVETVNEMSLIFEWPGLNAGGNCPDNSNRAHSGIDRASSGSEYSDKKSSNSERSGVVYTGSEKSGSVSSERESYAKNSPERKNPGKKPVLLLAHMDVVPVEDSASWTHPPFSGTLEDGFVWGRGTLDDKGSIIAIMEASEKLLQEGFIPQRSIYFAFGHDEEIGGRDGALEMARRFDERGIRFEYSLDEGGMVTEGVVPGMTPPVALIGIAEKGYLSLELTARGQDGHSSMPPDENSVVILSDAVGRLQDEPFPARLSESVNIFLDHVGPEQSFFNRLAINNRWLFRRMIIRSYSASASGNATVRTTMAPTMLRVGIKDNVIPAESRAVVNFRLLPGTTKEDVIRHVEQAMDDNRVEIRQYGNYMPASPVSSHESPGFIRIRDLARDHFDSVAVAPYLVIAGTDSRHYTEVATDSYRFLPNLYDSEDLGRIHGIDERISFDNFQTMLSFYYHFLGDH